MKLPHRMRGIQSLLHAPLSTYIWNCVILNRHMVVPVFKSCSFSTYLATKLPNSTSRLSHDMKESLMNVMYAIHVMYVS